MTPSGTRTRWNASPLGRVHSASTVPTGSGSSAISSSPLAMASTRVSSSISRSMKASVRPASLAAAVSLALAARILAVDLRRQTAAARSAAFFDSVEASARVRAAARARCPTRRMASSVAAALSMRSGLFIRLHILAHYFLASAMSSRWISSSQRETPRIAAISPLFLPMIRSASILRIGDEAAAELAAVG